MAVRARACACTGAQNGQKVDKIQARNWTCQKSSHYEVENNQLVCVGPIMKNTTYQLFNIKQAFV